MINLEEMSDDQLQHFRGEARRGLDSTLEADWLIGDMWKKQIEAIEAEIDRRKIKINFG